MTTPEQPPIDEPVPAAEPAPEEADDLSAFEAAVGAMVLAMLTSWLAKANKAVTANTERYGSAPDSDEIMFLAKDWENMVDRDLLPELERVQHAGWLRHAPARRSFPEAEAVMQFELNRARNLLVRIPNEVYDLINAELRQSALDGDDVYHQARRVDAILKVTGSQRWPNRAKVIAVTEVNRAYAASILAGGYQSQADEGRQLFKRWDSSRDSRVREWHRAADGQVRALGTAFSVGPDQLQYPGDPDGLPHNVINCRCTLDIVDGDEISGR